jgi:DNA (cytosine-5)-methyltransferase 1
MDILVRLLQPHELARAHSFPDAYKFTGTKDEQTKQIGNSVPVELAAAHAQAILSHDGQNANELVGL